MCKRTVLIVEDDKGIANGVALRLQSVGYSTLHAEDGNEGVDASVRHLPDVVLMDVRMPNMDGLSALNNMKSDERTKQIPVIMLSASLRDQETALQAGAQFFLTKPCRSGDLLLALESVLKEKTIAAAN